MRTFAPPTRRRAGTRESLVKGRLPVTPRSVDTNSRRTEIHRILHGSRLQKKLTVGPPGDVFEREADRMAEQVMRTREPEERVQRTCAECEEDLQTKRRPGVAGDDASVPEGVAQRLSSGGRGGHPLPKTMRTKMEAAFGKDFGSVSLHTDGEAALLSQAVGARAFTHRGDIYFNQGEYSPNSPRGKRLLAHELAHVVQQGVVPKVASVTNYGANRPGSNGGGSPHTQETNNVQHSAEHIARAPKYIPGVQHNHQPSRDWKAVQDDPKSGFLQNRVCANTEPSSVVAAAIGAEFTDKPIALTHLFHYLSGSGSDYVEDANIEKMLLDDRGVQYKLRRLVSPDKLKRGHFEMLQKNYDSKDFRYTFGNIDRVDYESDPEHDILHVWFQDRYEWHPVYPGLYTSMDGDKWRETNCVHAALVELKSGGAADFWMKGEAMVALEPILKLPDKRSDLDERWF